MHIYCKTESMFLVLHCVMTEGRLMKDATLPLHTNSLASRNAQYLQVPTKALEAADVSSSESQTTKQPNCFTTNWKSARMS